MKCEICGDEVKNLGVHKYHKHRDQLAPGSIIAIDDPKEIIVDVPTDKRLSELINAMKELLKPYQNKITVSYEEEGSLVKSIEFTARIQIRR